MRGQPALLHRLRRVFCVRRRSQEVPAHPEKESNLVMVHLFDRFDGVSAVLARGNELKLTPKFLPEGFVHALPDAHRPVALHVGMSAHRARSRSRPSDVSTEQEEIHHLLDSRDRILVLGQSHRPARDDAFASHCDLGCFADLGTGQGAPGEDIVPGSLAQMPDERFEAGGMFIDERAIENRFRDAFLLGQHLFHDAAHRRHVAIQPYR